MYVPKHFSQDKEEKVRKLIDQNGFVTILSFPKNERPFINQLPVIFSPRPNEEEILIGHMARRNPQWLHFIETMKGFEEQVEVLKHLSHFYEAPSATPWEFELPEDL